MRSIDGFLKSIGLDKVKVDENELQYRLFEPREDFVVVGRLTKKERRLYAAQTWCYDNAQVMAETSGNIVFCEKEIQETVLKSCQKKYDNRAKLANLEVICAMFLTLVVHERLNISAEVNFYICRDYLVCVIDNEEDVDNEQMKSIIWVPTILNN
ncbi:hypothetical protein CVU83_01415 [Candidatus Falkowbacteria bacterium HGW-Falkowbacteria-2]|uniref:Uncharacterized protein n=1 Tax=Candidatus Falkowbacteria bacterium HGW-Falkowbacteria-2 TaxID=2013769 RepID=A0A2N2E1I1_9BACT|nr:MAG: hypothetical protein CVU83_01415 [Candidatus Falkowbacteria bacterium HGW-Falkowbacteria-2]